MPKVSIIVPVYKVEPYLRRCVDSILNQTYQDHEIILVDDGSPDNCGIICDEYAKNYDCISVIHKENGGLSDARNAGVKVANGDWGLFIDSDDLIHPQTLEFLVKTADETDSNIVYCGRLKAENVSKDFWRNRELSYNVFEINENQMIKLYQTEEEIVSDVYWVVVPKLIRISILRKFPFTKGRIYEDNAVAFRQLIEAKKVAVVNEKMYFYMINQFGIMHSQFSRKKLDFLWALEQQIECYQKIGYKRIQKIVIEDYFRNVVYFGKRMINESNDAAMCSQLMREAEKKEKLFLKYCSFDLDKSTRNFIIKYSHPNIFRIKKKIQHIKSFVKTRG